MLNNTFINFNQNGKILFTDKDENNNETTMDLSTLISNNIIQIFRSAKRLYFELILYQI